MIGCVSVLGQVRGLLHFCSAQPCWSHRSPPGSLPARVPHCLPYTAIWVLAPLNPCGRDSVEASQGMHHHTSRVQSGRKPAHIAVHHSHCDVWPDCTPSKLGCPGEAAPLNCEFGTDSRRLLRCVARDHNVVNSLTVLHNERRRVLFQT
jgi:hypothetical protein